jgi:peptidoglycan/xylan/chitin deacetylase (PgdA/CDA1 family)/3D (Asp-Asp-Asp) domain-containing protein
MRSLLGTSIRILLILTIVTIIAFSSLLVRSLGRAELNPDQGNNSFASKEHPVLCNCIIFRLDDIADWNQPGEHTVMNMFLSKNLKLTLAIIMHFIGNDTTIIDKVKEGYQKGLFELALHGWNHVDYTKLSLADQKSTMLMANIKMHKIFGTTSDMFFPPYGPFNNDTIEAMRQLGLQIISTDPNDEYIFDNGRSIFVSGASEPNHEANNTVYHMSATINYKSVVTGVRCSVASKSCSLVQKLYKHPIEEILADVVQGMRKYGYAIITLHPQDFLKMNYNYNNQLQYETFGGKVIVNETETRDLSRLINYITSHNIPIRSFHEVLGYKEPANHDALAGKESNLAASTAYKEPADLHALAGKESNHPPPPPVSGCTTGWFITGYINTNQADYPTTPATTIMVGGQMYSFNTQFLHDIQINGYGLTKYGWYLSNDGSEWVSTPNAYDAEGNRLVVGKTIAVDRTQIPLGTTVTIPTLRAPWNSYQYVASDTGGGVVGKHIDVFTGTGKAAAAEADAITGYNNTICK